MCHKLKLILCVRRWLHFGHFFIKFITRKQSYGLTLLPTRLKQISARWLTYINSQNKIYSNPCGSCFLVHITVYPPSSLMHFSLISFSSVKQDVDSLSVALSIRLIKCLPSLSTPFRVSPFWIWSLRISVVWSCMPCAGETFSLLPLVVPLMIGPNRFPLRK